MTAQEAQGRANALLSQVGSLSSITEVHQWDQEATETVEHLKVAEQQLINESNETMKTAQAKLQEHKAKGLWKRMTTPNESLMYNKRAKDLMRESQMIPPLIERLESWIELTPNSVEEAKLAISEYKLAKKDLALQKKELSSQARGVREAYSQKNTRITAGWGNSKSKQFARSMARMSKERQLAGVQNERDAVEQQILQIDRLILWMERIIK